MAAEQEVCKGVQEKGMKSTMVVQGIAQELVCCVDIKTTHAERCRETQWSLLQGMLQRPLLKTQRSVSARCCCCRCCCRSCSMSAMSCCRRGVGWRMRSSTTAGVSQV